MQVKSGIDWFELHGRVDFGDGRSTSIAELLAALQRAARRPCCSTTARAGWCRRSGCGAMRVVAAFGETKGDHVRYPPVAGRAARRAARDASRPMPVDEAFARARAELAQFSGIVPLDPPATFHGHAARLSARGARLVRVPAAVRLRRLPRRRHGARQDGHGARAARGARGSRASQGTPRPRSSSCRDRSSSTGWTRRALRAGAARAGLHGRRSRDLGTGRASTTCVLTTYGTLRRDAAVSTEHEFDYVILDEAQAIKNAATASAKAARLLARRHRLALSGTPIENHLGELWSLFEFLNPACSDRRRRSRRRAIRPRQTAPTARSRAPGARALRPFILRRTKEQVAPELPAKPSRRSTASSNAAQRALRRAARPLPPDAARDGREATGSNGRRCRCSRRCCGCARRRATSGLIDETRTAEPSAKLDVLLPRLRRGRRGGAQGARLLAVHELLALLRPRLDAKASPTSISTATRAIAPSAVERFQDDPACPVFLISLKAGGLGLNLTAAEYVFLLDPWWNPAVEAQAIDRAHRIGQTRHVFAYRLIARDTVEEKIAELQRSKRELADAIFSADAGLMRDAAARGPRVAAVVNGRRLPSATNLR